MKILYDHQTFTIQKYGGISRYFYEIIKRINKSDNTSISLLFSDNEYIKKRDISKHISIPFKNKYKNSGYTRFNEQFTKFKLKYSNYEIFHPTYYDPYFLNIVKTPFVVTCHDLIHEMYADKYDKLKIDNKSIKGKELLLRKANHIIAISNNTKNDIINIYNINPEKISVIYHGITKNEIVINKNNYNLNFRYLLFVGNRDLYKNFDNLLFAFKEILNKDNELKLVCIGSPFSNNEIDLINKYKCTNHIINFGYIDDNDIDSFYENAIAFIFPSCYEGFGIPILEAFKNNCPVILSNTSCFPEIAGDAGIYFDPNSVESIIETIKSSIYNNELLNEKVKKGSQKIKKYTWESTALNTLNVYNKIV